MQLQQYNATANATFNAPPTPGLNAHLSGMEDLVSLANTLLARARAFGDHLHGPRPMEAEGISKVQRRESVMSRFGDVRDDLGRALEQLSTELSRIEAAI